LIGRGLVSSAALQLSKCQQDTIIQQTNLEIITLMGNTTVGSNNTEYKDKRRFGNLQMLPNHPKNLD
jgi:hypothetical protein